MPKRTLAKILAMALTAGVLTSCGSSNSVTPNPAKGSLITIVEDAPICNVISATLTLTGLSFAPVGGGANASYLTTTASFAPSIRLNLQQLRDFNTILYVFNVNAGNYNQANLLVELAQVATYEPTLTPPVKLLTTTLTQPKPTIALSSPLVITPGQANVLLLDFDVLHMLQANAAGQLTGVVKPVISVTPLTAANGNGFAEFDDLSGFVRSVTLSNTTSNPLYTGSFLMQLLSPSVSGAPAMAVNLTANTNLVGFPDLAHLVPDSYMEVDATLDSQGNLAGNTVEFQALEHPYASSSTKPASTALIGPIVSISTDQVGNPTQFNLWVRDAEPMDPSNITLDSIFQVNLSSGTVFQVSALGPNFANLGFGPLNLAVGQEVVVHGVYTRPPASTGTKSNLPVTVNPSAIFLKLQSLQGSLGSIVQIGSDNLTGAFVLNPCCTLLQGAPIYVLTNNQTTFVNTNGLGGLTSQEGLLVKGMPFFEPQAGTINGVPIPAGTLVVEAKQVRRLQM
jgi:hypothetical protein